MWGCGRDMVRERGSSIPIYTLSLISILMYPFIHPFTHSTKCLSCAQPNTRRWSHMTRRWPLARSSELTVQGGRQAHLQVGSPE